MSAVSTKPYLIRAIYEWCVDQAFTPYIAVVVDGKTRVPQQYVRDGQIVLNLGPEAVQQLILGNDTVTCSARFGGVAQSVCVPIENVAAIYARENGHGMAFEVTEPAKGLIAPSAEDAHLATRSGSDGATPEKPSGPRPHLTRIK